MPNPDSPFNGQSKELPYIVDKVGTAGLTRGYGDEDFGGDDPAKHVGVAAIPAAAGAVVSSAGAASMAPAMAAVASKMNYLDGFSIGGKGATSAVAIEVTITGLSIGTMKFWLQIPAGVSTAIEPIFVTFPSPIPASAVNTAITLNVPSFGTGNTDAEAAVWGHVSP